MQLQLILFIGLISSSFASGPEKALEGLFKKYESVMDEKKVDLIEEVFTKNFIKESGGKKELINKITHLPKPLATPPRLKWVWKKGSKSNLYLAKVSETPNSKISAISSELEFIIVKEEGRYKIEGTISHDD